MEFLIRADASVHIGSGHVMRCITLAHALQRRGHRSTFVMRAHDGHLADFVRAHDERAAGPPPRLFYTPPRPRDREKNLMPPSPL